MAHSVQMKMTTNVVASKDIEITVNDSKGRLGTLLISKGNIEWRPAFKSVKRHQLSWRKFAETMESEGRTVKKASGKKK